MDAGGRLKGVPFSPSLRKLPRALLKELPNPMVGVSPGGAGCNRSPVHLSLNPVFGRSSAVLAAKQQHVAMGDKLSSVGSLARVDKENALPDAPAVSFVDTKPVVPPLAMSPGQPHVGPFTFTAVSTPSPSLSTRSGSVIRSRSKTTPRRKGSKIITTNPLPYLLESMSVSKRQALGCTPTTPDHGPVARMHAAPKIGSPLAKIRKKEARQQRKHLKMIKKGTMELL